MSIFCTVAFATKDISHFIKDFKAHKYNKVCSRGIKLYYRGYTDENFVSLVGISCSKVDRINILGMLQRSLVNTKESRENASYFATLILQKRLIYQFMIDNIELNNLKLPSSNHILSRVFDQLNKHKYKILSKSPKLIEIEDGNKKLILSVSDDDPVKVLVDEYKKDGELKRHWYQ